MKSLGPGSNRHPLLYEKPTANSSLTWVRDNHTFKLGGELRLDSNISTLYTNTNGIYAFNSNETALPYLQTATTGGGNVGFAYASFLLGAPDSVDIAPSQQHSPRQETSWPLRSGHLEDHSQVDARLRLALGLLGLPERTVRQARAVRSIWSPMRLRAAGWERSNLKAMGPAVATAISQARILSQSVPGWGWPTRSIRKQSSAPDGESSIRVRAMPTAPLKAASPRPRPSPIPAFGTPRADTGKRHPAFVRAAVPEFRPEPVSASRLRNHSGASRLVRPERGPPRAADAMERRPAAPDLSRHRR